MIPLAPIGRSVGLGRQANLAYELPLTFVDSYEGIVYEIQKETGLLPAFGWKGDDANAPSHWLGAVNLIDRLTAVGAPVADHTPWLLENGQAVPCEIYDGTCYRDYTTAGINPAAGEDVAIVTVFRCRRDPTIVNEAVFSTRGAAQGINIFSSNGQLFRAYVSAGGGVGNCTFAGAGVGNWVVGIAIIDRDALIHAWTRGGVATVATPGGGIGGIGVTLAAYTGGAFGVFSQHTIASVIYLYGAGIANVFTAGTYAFCQHIARLATGIERRTGFAGPTATRNTAASWQDSHNRRHHLANAGLYRAGSVLAGGESGLRLAPARTNKCYQNVNITAAGAAIWTVDDASNVGRIDDSAALAAAAEPAESWGPWVCRYANATGANRYMWIPGQTGNVQIHNMQVMARIVAGAGAQLGWWSVGGAAFTFVANIVDGYLRTVASNLTPPAADCCLCLMLPNGCELRWIAHDMGEGVTVTSPIPNWSTVAGAARAAEGIQLPMPPDNGQGGYEIGITPMGWGAGVGGQEFVISRVGVADQAIYMTAADLWATYDGVTVCAEGAATAAAGVRQVIRVGWHGARQTITVDGVQVATVYAGARMGGGNIAIYPILREWAIDSVKVLRRPAP